MPPHSVPAWIQLTSWAIRHMPCGRYRAASWLARFGRGPFVARSGGSAGDFLFWCDLRDVIARDVCFTGEYEPQETLIAAAILRAGMTVIDVGANWGYFTLLASCRVLPAGRVLAFEPEARLFGQLQRNVALNGFDGVDLFALAAAAGEGVLALEEYDDRSGNRGLSRITRSGPAEGRLTTTVPGESVDAIVGRTPGIDRIDLIKIDVEGYEHQVLAGMRSGLQAHRYRHVLIELHPALLANHGARVEDCCTMLERAGYHGWTVDHARAATRRVAYRRTARLSDFLHRASRPPAGDPWPHMMWSAPDASPLS